MPLPLAALGPVDVVVISHDHYDHLDLPTIKALAGTDTPVRGAARRRRPPGARGVPADRLRELDWHGVHPGSADSPSPPPGKARHFCGRGLRNTQHTLWASWTVAGDEHRIYHSGDTGYFDGFKDIGAAHGPFDATMIQIGAYSEFWPDIHATPEEGLRAHLDLQGGAPHGVLLPIHWGTLQPHPASVGRAGEWTKEAAEEAGQAVALPRPGEPFEPAGKLPAEAWWRGVSGDVRRTWRSVGAFVAEPPARGYRRPYALSAVGPRRPPGGQKNPFPRINVRL